MTVISYPIPPYSNLPIAAYDYQPSQFFISSIVLGINTLVTTTQNLNYVIGNLVRLIIPPSFGCRQLNGASGYVVGVPAANQVLVAIDSSKNVDPFTTSSATTQPQIVSLGDINTGQTNLGRSGNATFIPGSFINISQ
jgi:hypothetical protein